MEPDPVWWDRTNTTNFVQKGPRMLTLAEALDILGRVGGDNAPTVTELTNARDTIARELHKNKASGDLAALSSLLESHKLAAAAVTAAEAEAAKVADDVDALLADVPNPDADPNEDDDADAAVDEAKEPVSASTGKILPIGEALERLGITKRPTTEVKEPDTGHADTEITVMLGNERHDDATWYDIGAAFKRASGSLKTGKERIARVTTKFAEERTLPGNIAANTRLVESLLSTDAVAASGGCCSLAEPIRDNPVYSSQYRPIRDGIPTLGAETAGAVETFPPICLPNQGANLWTCEQDAAVDPADPATWKECLEIECEDSLRTNVEAIYACLTIGNFQHRFAPEQWAGWLQAVAALQARRAEVALFNKMITADGVTNHDVDATGSVYLTIINGAARAAATIRQDQRYRDIQMTYILPEWVQAAMRSDLRSRRLASDDIERTNAQIAAAFGNEGINVIWTPDVNPIEEESPGQVDGPLSPYPAIADGMLFPEGTFSFLDGGTLDLGTEIRDHDLNRQNKLAAFTESWEGLLARVCNAKHLMNPVEVCNLAPCPGGEESPVV